jgi:hypothetical protein
MDAFKNDKDNLRATNGLTDAIANVLERTAYEGWLLEMYNHITNDRAREDAEKLMHEHYADLAKMTVFSVEAAHLVSRSCKTKELCTLAAKVEGDIQKIADRYQALSKE